MPSTRAKYLSLEQSKELLRQLKADTTFRGVRDYALALFLMTVADRKVKAHQITMRDLSAMPVTALPFEMIDALNRYFEQRPRMGSDHIFLQWDGTPLTTFSVYAIVREWGLKFGIELTPTTLQHQRVLTLLKSRKFEDMRTLLEAYKKLDKKSQQDVCFDLARELVTGLE